MPTSPLRLRLPPLRLPLPLALALLGAGLTSGCMHSARAERVQLETLRESLEAHVFPLPVADAHERLVELGRRGALAVTVEGEGPCEVGPCRVQLGSTSWVELVLRAGARGGTRVEVPRAAATGGSSLLAQAWGALGREGLADAVEVARREAEVVALEEWRSFEPRWSASAAAFFVAGKAHTGFGARAGVRRWGEPHVLTGALAEYELDEVLLPGAALRQRAHLLALPLRVELAPWSDFGARHSLPEVSVSLLAGPSLLLPAGGWGSPQPGLRVGLGVQLLRVSDSVLTPLLLEVQMQQHGMTMEAARDLRLLVGVGF